MLCRVPWEFADKIYQIVFKKNEYLQRADSVENYFHKYTNSRQHNYLNESLGIFIFLFWKLIEKFSRTRSKFGSLEFLPKIKKEKN